MNMIKKHWRNAILRQLTTLTLTLERMIDELDNLYEKIAR